MTQGYVKPVPSTLDKCTLNPAKEKQPSVISAPTSPNIHLLSMANGLTYLGMKATERRKKTDDENLKYRHSHRTNLEIRLGRLENRPQNNAYPISSLSKDSLSNNSTIMTHKKITMTSQCNYCQRSKSTCISAESRTKNFRRKSGGENPVSEVIYRTKQDILVALQDQWQWLWENKLRKRTKISPLKHPMCRRKPKAFLRFISILFLFIFRCQPSSAIPIRWDLGPFSDCSVTCGRGVQNRSVVCREMPEGQNHSAAHLYHKPKGHQMPNLMCPAPKPHESQPCSQTACPPEWVHGMWGKCSKNCGRGVQSRNRRCMQKLGTGQTVRVHDHYCPKNKSFTKRYCNLKRSCPPRWMVTPWSPCSATCGTSYQKRVVICGQYHFGRSKPLRLSVKRCGSNSKPNSRKNCRVPICVNAPSSFPVIRSSHEEFIQENKQPKIRLLVGQTASVMVGTIVVIKCQVHNFPLENIKWYYDGQTVQRSQDQTAKIRVSVLEDGSLRIIRARITDSGQYICSAGESSESSTLSVVAINDLTTSPSKELELLLDEVNNARDTDFLDDEGLDFEDIGALLNSQPAPLRVSPRMNKFHYIRQRPRLLPTPAPPPEVMYPQLSHVVSRPILLVQPRGRFYSRNGYQNPVSRKESSIREEHPQDLVSSILEFMDEEGLDRSSSGSLSGLLDQLVEISSMFEQGVINEEERNDRSRNILAELNLLLETDRQRISPRGNSARSTKVVRLQRIVRILEAQVQDKPAAIIPQPTMAPLQLGDDVTAYVGGHLMVAAASRITILCEASGIPFPEITWYRNGNQLPEHGRQFVLREGSLRLLFPQLSDSGTYTCVASNSGGNASESTELSVMQKPRIQSTTSTLEDFTSDFVEATVGSDIRAKLGSRIVIRCPAEGYPDPYVVWRKDASGLGANTNVLADNSLEIYPATAAYQGLFGCEASNPAGSDYQASSLVLIDPPHISDELNVLPDIDGVFGLPGLLVTGLRTEYYDIKANSTVMMGCPVSGFPTPSLTWLFDGQPLTESTSIFEYQLMKEDKVLQISRADFNTEGTYSCFAQNDGGNLTTRLNLRLIVYTYQFGEMSPCSASCGDNGLHFRRLKCMQDGAKEVDEWYCTGLHRPALTMESCNRIDCPPKSVPGHWSSCSVSCGNGTRTRAPSCVVLMSDGSTRKVAAAACSHENHTVEMGSCFERSCPEWKPGPWKSCSRKCVGRGVGWKTRKIYCASSDGKKVNSKLCAKLVKPRRKSLCSNPRCEPTWVTSSWSVCSQSCGKTGIKTRIVNCVYQGRKRQPAGNQCSNHGVPAITLPCNRRPCLSKGRKLKFKSTQRIRSRVCKDRYSWCSRVKKLGLCTKKTHLRNCCQSCRKTSER